jgi:tRNA nucleotidyltransferase/poly(A) polymerase/pimeloyl-ACP methyl ester carboxylesterase
MGKWIAVNEERSPYAGRWVALVRGRVVAQGGTPEQALRASQFSRNKERPQIVFMTLPFSLPPLLDKVKAALPPEQDIYLVGGAVRDLLLSRPSPDLDFALPAGGISIARKLANALKADFVALDDERDTGRVVVANDDGSRVFLDFAAYRGVNLEEDLSARDFTINAIAYNLRDGTMIDPTDGVRDIRAKVIRACSPAAFSDDPVRILRAVRQAAAFGFTIDKSSREWMKQAAGQVDSVSAERLRDEIFKMLGGPKSNASIRALEMLGVLTHLMPELLKMKGVEQSAPHVYDVWAHTLAVLDYLDQVIRGLRMGYDAEKTNDMYTGLLGLRLGRYREQIAQYFSEPLNIDRPHRSLLFFAALYHDVCKPETKTIDDAGRIRFFDHDVKGAEVVAARARAFNLSNNEIERLGSIVRHHMRFHNFANRLEHEKQTPSRRAIYRFFRDSDGAGIDLILFALADLRGTYASDLTIETWTAYLDVARILLENYWEKPEEIIAPPRLVDGRDLMKELNLQPGRVIGHLLEAIREHQAAGRVETREQALAFAREEFKKGVLVKQMKMKKINVNGIELAYVRRGAGKPMLLVHGFPLDHSIWDAVAAELEGDFDLIIPDLRGFGQSAIVEGTYQMSDLADDLAALLTDLKIEQTSIVGHSMGGYVALAFAKKYPERVSGLALVASQAGADEPGHKEGRYKTAQAVSEKGVGVVVEAMTTKLSSDAGVQNILRATMEKQNPAAVSAALKAMAEREDMKAVLPSFIFPIVLSHGDADALIPIDRAREIKELVGDAVLIGLPGAGHMPMMEFPQETADTLKLLK